MTETYATNPAGVRPQLTMFLRNELTTMLVIGVLVSLIVLPLGWFVWSWLWLGFLLVPVAIYVLFYGNSRLSRLGACCPAKVVSLDPPRLAIFSDMSMRPDASHPAIIVKAFNPSKISGSPVRFGERLAVAAFYEPGDEQLPEERWKTLSVIEPIRAMTSDEHDIRRTLASIEADEWEQLEAGAICSQPPHDERIYFLEAGQKAGGQGVTEGRVHLVSADDPEMQKTQGYGRKTLRFFLRENYWEKRRIVPGLDLAAVKIAFSDPPEIRSQHPHDLEVEYMWISEVEFDGQHVSGLLLNEPDSLKSVHEGDRVSVSPSQVVDWMYSVMGEVCGGFTVQRMRSRLSKRELRQHDQAWGLEFGEPAIVRLVPDSYLPGEARQKRTPLQGLEGMFIQGDYKVIDREEHPMSVNTRSMIAEALSNAPEQLYAEDDAGLPLLHSLTVAGSLDGVEVCLQRGADPSLVANNGMTPLKLAKSLGWKKVQSRLEQAGAE